MPPRQRRRAREDEDDDDERPIEGVAGANPVRAVANLFSLERNLIRNQTTGEFRIADPLFRAFVAAPGMTIIQSPVAVLGARAQLLAFDPVLSPALLYVQKLELNAVIPAADTVHNALLGCVLAELGALYYFFAMSLTGTTQSHRTLIQQYSILACGAQTLLSTPANKIDDIGCRSLVSTIMQAQGLPTFDNYPNQQKVSLPHTFSIPTQSTTNLPGAHTPLPTTIKKHRTPKGTQVCTKCGGKGHELPACTSPHPQCRLDWNCGICGGKGHSPKFCPSE